MVLIEAEVMEKTLEDEKCEPEIALVWDISAKNVLQNHLGHNPNEVVVGFNINILLVLTDQLLALDVARTIEMVRTNLNALHAVMKNFIEAESSEKT